ncbi:MAG: bifunctional 4-hydroxy-3-methylbut-2-enyl diphosphate reductase/30S ribosomal protein, partial [Oscillospiraceae bacterium]|nr:bifunctional 4-hydroxy-3-methylbut-2-enyl diphosphate reductase/30S ribosomal protein [Oscillospiraceae bacterium]
AKQAGFVPIAELTDDPNAKSDDIVKKGDEIDLIVLKVNDQEGTVMLSKKRCDAEAGFEVISKAYEEGTILDGVVTDVVRGGVLVLTNSVKIFIPASQASGARVENLEELLRKPVQFKIIEIKENRRRAVGSVRAVVKEQRQAVAEKFWSDIEVGKIYKGEVKSLTSFGAFVDLGGVDGLIHITELSWSKIKHPSEVVKTSDVVEVYVKDLDKENKKISLGYKKTEDNPWERFKNEYTVDQVVNVKIVSLTPFGAFAEIIPGVDGLIHISQIANERVTKVADFLSIGQTVDAKITEVELDKKRISLSIRAILEEKEAVKQAEAIAEELPEGVEFSSDSPEESAE